MKLMQEVGGRDRRRAGSPTDGGGGLRVAVKAGDKVLVDIFGGEKYVDVVGTSKGRGFSRRRTPPSFWRRS